ncbi:hypothetical protein WJX73_007895 [Symbiochloris irregularis]|uniref:Uncharacterized protein n=1 Tax=Symbiochloris irregularis TaxID=706552 RepID=A0AAW1NQW4_9CHLO
MQASHQITHLKTILADGLPRLEPFLAYLQQLPNLRSLQCEGTDPRLLFHVSSLTRLTWLGLPAPSSSQLDDAFYLLQLLPDLRALAVGRPYSTSISRDLPSLSLLTQLSALGTAKWIDSAAHGRKSGA